VKTPDTLEVVEVVPAKAAKALLALIVQARAIQLEEYPADSDSLRERLVLATLTGVLEAVVKLASYGVGPAPESANDGRVRLAHGLLAKSLTAFACQDFPAAKQRASSAFTALDFLLADADGSGVRGPIESVPDELKPLHFCCSAVCPGYSFKASDLPHPCPGNEPGSQKDRPMWTEPGADES